MTDTELLPRCPLCDSLDIIEKNGMVARTIRCDKPGDPPEEVELKIYVCQQCGRMFNEMEAQPPHE
jgi:transposase-like protein